MKAHSGEGVNQSTNERQQSISWFKLCLMVLLTISPAYPCNAAETQKLSSKPADLMKIIEAQKKWREEVEVENRQLREEIAVLKVERAALGTNYNNLVKEHASVTNRLNFLELNDYLMENRETLVSQFEAKWEPIKNDIFAAVWQQGQLLQFEVDDVFLYRSNVFASLVFLWSNGDGTGGVGRLNISMDPLNDLKVVGLNVVQQRHLNPQVFAGIKGAGVPSAGALPATGRSGSNDIATSEDSSKPILSEQTKNKLIDTGIGLAAFAVMEGIKKWMESQAVGGAR